MITCFANLEPPPPPASPPARPRFSLPLSTFSALFGVKRGQERAQVQEPAPGPLRTGKTSVVLSCFACRHRFMIEVPRLCFSGLKEGMRCVELKPPRNGFPFFFSFRVFLNKLDRDLVRAYFHAPVHAQQDFRNTRLSPRSCAYAEL